MNFVCEGAATIRRLSATSSTNLDTHRVERPPMSGVLELSFIFLVVGARGFTRRGLPFTAKRQIHGARGRIVGSLCLLVGILSIAFAFWASPPADRQAIRSLCYGVV